MKEYTLENFLREYKNKNFISLWEYKLLKEFLSYQQKYRHIEFFVKEEENNYKLVIQKKLA